ncbi:MAG: class I SAM-dependent methyltransferase [Paludibacteraceae bacterium]
MHLFENLRETYTHEAFSAQEAQHLAHIYSWGPVVFQVARLMNKYGIFEMLAETKEGLTRQEICERTGLSNYAVKCLLESSLTMQTILLREQAGGEDRYVLAKTGWFLLRDQMIRADIDFNHDVNYEGWFLLDKALEEGKPAGLKHFGDWQTIYEGLSSLPKQVQKSWFGFDHYYSDHSFDEALQIILSHPTDSSQVSDFKEHSSTRLHLLDIGGNTGRFALHCVGTSENIEVTICDLPQQIELMRAATAGRKGAERIDGIGVNLLDPNQELPADRHFDVVWMSQFLDCFGEDEIVSILSRVRKIMQPDTRIYVMETLWDRQDYAPAAFCLTQTSLYFTALANGNSKMYNTDDMTRLIRQAGLQIEQIHDRIGNGGHSIIVISNK